MTISQRKLSWNAKPIIGGYGTPKFRGENFAGGPKTAKFVNVFSLENFPLYSIYIYSMIPKLIFR